MRDNGWPGSRPIGFGNFESNHGLGYMVIGHRSIFAFRDTAYLRREHIASVVIVLTYTPTLPLAHSHLRPSEQIKIVASH
jgi:hypothetical protein